MNPVPARRLARPERARGCLRKARRYQTISEAACRVLMPRHRSAPALGRRWDADRGLRSPVAVLAGVASWQDAGAS